MDKEGFLGNGWPRLRLPSPGARVLPPVSGPPLERHVLARACACRSRSSSRCGRRGWCSSRSATSQWGAYRFAWGFGFFQFLFEFGASSALQRQISEAWTRGDRDAVDRSIACGMTFYTVVAFLQMAALLGVAYWALPADGVRGRVVPIDRQAAVAPGRDGALLRVLGGGFERAPGRPAVRFHAAARALQHDRAVRRAGGRTQVADSTSSRVVVAQTVLQVGIGLVPGLWVMIRELGHRPHFGGARLCATTNRC